MATVKSLAIVRDGSSLNRKFDSKDGIVKIWEVHLAAETTDPLEVYIAARDYPPTGTIGAKEDKLPAEGEVYDDSLAPHLFALSFDTKPKNKANLTIWRITVKWGVPPIEDGTSDGTPQVGDPLLRDPVVSIEFIAVQYSVLEAENLQVLPHADGSGGNRPISGAGNLGPIVNAAGKRADEPLQDTTYNAVLTSKRNYATLGEIYRLNTKYQKSANSDTFHLTDLDRVNPENLKYMVTDSEGPIIEGGFSPYYKGTTRIEVLKDYPNGTGGVVFRMDNQGYSYWDPDPPQGKNGEPAGVPRIRDDEDAKDLLNLDLDGTILGTSGSGSKHTTIDYRHLKIIPYQNEFFL